MDCMQLLCSAITQFDQPELLKLSLGLLIKICLLSKNMLSTTQNIKNELIRNNAMIKVEKLINHKNNDIELLAHAVLSIFDKDADEAENMDSRMELDGDEQMID